MAPGKSYTQTANIINLGQSMVKTVILPIFHMSWMSQANIKLNHIICILPFQGLIFYYTGIC